MTLEILPKLPCVFWGFIPSLRLHAAKIMASASSSVVLSGILSWTLTIVDL